MFRNCRIEGMNLKKDYNNKNFWNRYSKIYDIEIDRFNRSAYLEMYKLISKVLTKDMKVLEIATGTGLIAVNVAHSAQSIVATDFSPKMIETATKKGVPSNVHFSVENATALSFPDHTFDAVIISNALHIMPDPGAVLKNIRRVLKPNGLLIAPTFSHGTAFYPELLSAFVTPNHPEVAKITARAAQLLGGWSGDPSLNAYQTQNPNRVLMQAAAVYGALQEQNIVYSVPPASFERVGQRVRLCDAIIQQKLGTCLDLTLFYAACLEAIGLHPILLLQQGHIFAGVWLEDFSFSESVENDPSLITKRIAEGVNEIAVVECTALVSGKTMSFDEAMSWFAAVGIRTVDAKAWAWSALTFSSKI